MTAFLLSRLLRKLGIRVGANPSSVTASRTLRLDDDKDELYCVSATDITLTIRHDLPAGWETEIIQGGAGKITVVGQVSETANDFQGTPHDIGNATVVHNVSGQYKSAGLGARMLLVQVSPNTYVLSGDTGA